MWQVCKLNALMDDFQKDFGKFSSLTPPTHHLYRKYLECCWPDHASRLPEQYHLPQQTWTRIGENASVCKEIDCRTNDHRQSTYCVTKTPERVLA